MARRESGGSRHRQRQLQRPLMCGVPWLGWALCLAQWAPSAGFKGTVGHAHSGQCTWTSEGDGWVAQTTGGEHCLPGGPSRVGAEAGFEASAPSIAATERSTGERGLFEALQHLQMAGHELSFRLCQSRPAASAECSGPTLVVLILAHAAERPHMPMGHVGWASAGQKVPPVAPVD